MKKIRFTQFKSQVSRLARSVFFVSIAVFLLLPSTVDALSQAQINVFNSGIQYFDVNGSTQSCATSTLSGSDAKQQVWNYFTSQPRGLSPVATAALMGNFEDESGFDPTATNPKSGAYGLAQWLGNRLTSLNSYASSVSASSSDLAVQLDFAWQELSGSYKSPVTDVINAPGETIQSATQTVYNYYEGLLNSGQGSVGHRVANAQGFMILYGSGSSANTNTDNTQSTITTSTCARSLSSALPSGNAQQLASQLEQYINSGAIKCDPLDGVNNVNCSDITNTASGVSIKGGEGCQVDALSPGLLGMLLKLVQMGHTFIITALCSDHSDTGTSNPGHSTGQAVDFNTIDGVFIGPNDNEPWTPEKIQAAQKLDQDIASFMPSSTGFGQIQCHPPFDFLNGFVTFQDGCSHQHVQVTD